MATTNLDTLFTYVFPFRDTLLSMLAPSEISKLFAALQCDPLPHEREKYLDVLDDIFEDSGVIHAMAKLGLTVRIFGADLEKLQARLDNPCAYSEPSVDERPFHIFVLVADSGNGPDHLATLVRDYRPETERGVIPHDMSLAELHIAFDPSTADEIANLSQWILSAPYLSGTLPVKSGWIPVFNSRLHVNVRAYISSFDDWNDRILHMDRGLMCQMFGYHDNRSLLYNLPSLSTVCIKLRGDQRCVQNLYGKLTMNILHHIMAASDHDRGSEKRKFVVVNTAYPLNSSITLTLE
jgi:hypothetical protein